jgi:hypothetical protein
MKVAEETKMANKKDVFVIKITKKNILRLSIDSNNEFLFLTYNNRIIAWLGW